MKQPKVKTLTFNNSEVRKLLNYFDGKTFLDIRNKTMIALFFDTGISFHAQSRFEAVFFMLQRNSG